MTAYAEVIGDPIAHSKSPAIHRFWLRKLGIDADYRATRITAAQIGDFIRARGRDTAWCGCNVTMPLKRAVMRELTGCDDGARRIGAVNTVVPEGNGMVTGRNTDADGFLEPLRGDLAVPHLFRMARLIGTGGAACAIAHALAAHGFTLVVAGRTRDSAAAFLEQLALAGDHHAIELRHFASPTDFAFDDRAGCLDLVVNATPLGMRGNAPLPFDWSHAPPGAIAYDIVTDPVRTPFLRDAAAAGHRTVDGLAMLIGQAAAAFALFFGRPPPREHDDELRALLTS